MTLKEEITNLANEYVAGRVTLTDVASWLKERLTTYADMADDDPASALWGFMQVRVWEHEKHTIPEADVRTELREYLSEEGLLTSSAARRAV